MLSVLANRIDRQAPRSIALCPTKGAELKSLYGAPKCGVVMTPRIDEFEVGSKNCAKNLRIIANYWQAATPFGPIRSKGAYDNMSTGPDGLLQMTDIG